MFFWVEYGTLIDYLWSATRILVCRSILSEVIIFVTSLIDMFTYVIFGLHVPNPTTPKRKG